MKPHDLTQSPDRPASLSDDLLDGVVAIARELGWKKPNGQWNVRRVYHARETGALPIRKDKGLRLYAFKSELRETLARQCSLPAARNGAKESA
mgnify:CR=1 FL=1